MVVINDCYGCICTSDEKCTVPTMHGGGYHTTAFDIAFTLSVKDLTNDDLKFSHIFLFCKDGRGKNNKETDINPMGRILI